MKKCTGCKIDKDTTEYHRKGNGLKPRCKECTRSARKRYYRQNKEAANTKSKEHYYSNREQALVRKRAYYQQNKASYQQRWSKRRAQKLQATPSWLTDEHKFMLDEIYELRQLRSEMTGVEHHVDHIVPLQGKATCGLHVPWNLQVIPATENLAKGNKA